MSVFIIALSLNLFAKRDFSEEKQLIPVLDSTNVEISIMKGSILVTPTSRDSIFFYCIKSAGEGFSADDITVKIDTTEGKTLKLSCSWENPDADYRGDIEVLLPKRILLKRAFTVSGDINIENVSGDCSVECFEGNIKVDGFNGLLSVYNMNGNIDIRNSQSVKKAENLEGNINVAFKGELADSSLIKTTSGKILLSLERNASAELMLHTLRGKVIVHGCLLKNTQFSEENTKRVVINGGKSIITVENTEGDIELKYAD